MTKPCAARWGYVAREKKASAGAEVSQQLLPRVLRVGTALAILSGITRIVDIWAVGMRRLYDAVTGWVRTEEQFAGYGINAYDRCTVFEPGIGTNRVRMGRGSGSIVVAGDFAGKRRASNSGSDNRKGGQDGDLPHEGFPFERRTSAVAQ